MCRIIRWIGYASTVIGAVLIILAIIGGFKFHHHYVHEHVMMCTSMQHHEGTMSEVKGEPGSCKKQAMMTKKDSASCKQSSMEAKKDSVGSKQNSMVAKPCCEKCCKMQAMCCSASAPAVCSFCRMHHALISFHIGLAMCFLLLAIALFMISNSCRCKKCRDDRKCECKEDKKE